MHFSYLSFQSLSVLSQMPRCITRSDKWPWVPKLNTAFLVPTSYRLVLPTALGRTHDFGTSPRRYVAEGKKKLSLFLGRCAADLLWDVARWYLVKSVDSCLVKSIVV